MRYLTTKILYPKPEHTGNILVTVEKVSDAARKFEGLVDIGAWPDKENNRIVNMSLWEAEDDCESR